PASSNAQPTSTSHLPHIIPSNLLTTRASLISMRQNFCTTFRGEKIMHQSNAHAVRRRKKHKNACQYHDRINSQVEQQECHVEVPSRLTARASLVLLRACDAHVRALTPPPLKLK